MGFSTIESSIKGELSRREVPFQVLLKDHEQRYEQRSSCSQPDQAHYILEIAVGEEFLLLLWNNWTQLRFELKMKCEGNKAVV